VFAVTSSTAASATSRPVAVAQGMVKAAHVTRRAVATHRQSLVSHASAASVSAVAPFHCYVWKGHNHASWRLVFLAYLALAWGAGWKRREAECRFYVVYLVLHSFCLVLLFSGALSSSSVTPLQSLLRPDGRNRDWDTAGWVGHPLEHNVTHMTRGDIGLGQHGVFASDGRHPGGGHDVMAAHALLGACHTHNE